MVAVKTQYDNIEETLPVLTMSAFTPAVDRYLKSCRMNNIQGVRAYLTTIHCNPQWAYRGLQYSAEALSVSALKLVCDYKKKTNADHDAEWVRLSTDTVKRLITSQTNKPETKEMLSLLLDVEPLPNFDTLARDIGDWSSPALLEIILPHLSHSQKTTAFERVCKRPNNMECVERMLVEVNLDSVWPRIKDSWDKPRPENAVIVENFLLRNTLINELENVEKAVFRRKM